MKAWTNLFSLALQVLHQLTIVVPDAADAAVAVLDVAGVVGGQAAKTAEDGLAVEADRIAHRFHQKPLHIGHGSISSSLFCCCCCCCCCWLLVAVGGFSFFLGRPGLPLGS